MSEREAACRPPRPGDHIWHYGREWILGDDYGLHPIPERAERTPWRTRLANFLFCTECFRLRVSPGHWLTRGWHS